MMQQQRLRADADVELDTDGVDKVVDKDRCSFSVHSQNTFKALYNHNGADLSARL
jgi:hypothetical protein